MVYGVSRSMRAELTFSEMLSSLRHREKHNPALAHRDDCAESHLRQLIEVLFVQHPSSVGRPNAELELYLQAADQ